VGVGVELSLMFAIAGLVASKVLPKDPTLKILGINNHLFFAILWAAFFSVLDLFGQDVRLCVGLFVVGRIAGVSHGLFPLLFGILV
jgi:hypothetical protein